jgi:hypothetical protein
MRHRTPVTLQTPRAGAGSLTVLSTIAQLTLQRFIKGSTKYGLDLEGISLKRVPDPVVDVPTGRWW